MPDPTLLILASLADGKKHGYAMQTDIADFARVALGPGTLYGAISRLEQDGLIEASGPTSRRRPYRITALGRKHLEARIAALAPVIRVGARRLRNA
ncbi:MAG: PadR family transcriptional regulator [Vicinamibacterales bacterium]